MDTVFGSDLMADAPCTFASHEGGHNAFSPDEMKVTGDGYGDDLEMDDSWSELCSPGSVGSQLDLCVEGRSYGVMPSMARPSIGVIPAIG